MDTTTTTATANQITPMHGTTNTAQLTDLTVSMRDVGWQGRRLLVIDTGDGYLALTGTHRIAAAAVAGVDIPVLAITTTPYDPDDSGSVLEAEQIDAILRAMDDDERLDALRETGLQDAIDLMDQEIRHNNR